MPNTTQNVNPGETTVPPEIHSQFAFRRCFHLVTNCDVFSLQEEQHGDRTGQGETGPHEPRLSTHGGNSAEDPAVPATGAVGGKIPLWSGPLDPYMDNLNSWKNRIRSPVSSLQCYSVRLIPHLLNSKEFYLVRIERKVRQLKLVRACPEWLSSWPRSWLGISGWIPRELHLVVTKQRKSWLQVHLLVYADWRKGDWGRRTCRQLKEKTVRVRQNGKTVLGKLGVGLCLLNKENRLPKSWVNPTSIRALTCVWLMMYLGWSTTLPRDIRSLRLVQDLNHTEYRNTERILIADGHGEHAGIPGARTTEERRPSGENKDWTGTREENTFAVPVELAQVQPVHSSTL